MIADIQQLEKDFFQKDKLEEIYKRYSKEEILQALKNTNSQDLLKVLQFCTEIARSDLYEDFLMGDFSVVKTLLEDPDERVRLIVSEALEAHTYEFASVIAQMFKEQNAGVLVLVLQVLLRQVSDPDSEVGLKGLKCFKKIFSGQQLQIRKELVNVLQMQVLVELFQTGLKLQDGVARLRFMELVVYLSNLNDEVQSTYESTGVLKTALDVYNTNDFLVKLNAIEIIQMMGESKKNAEFLSKQNFFEQILKDAMNEKEDFYVRKYQIILLSKVISQRLTQLHKFEKQLHQVMKEWFQSGPEFVEGALEMLSWICMISEGLDFLMKSEDILFFLYNGIHSTKDTIKQKALSCLAGIFTVDQQVPKQPSKIYQIFTLIGNKRTDFDEGLMINSAKLILQFLHLPIQEMELISLHLLRNLVQWKEILRALISQEKFLSYFTKYAQNKEIYDLKGLVVKDLQFFCDQDDDFKAFGAELRDLKKIQEMQVESEYKI